MRKNKPYCEWYAKSFCANRSLIAILHSLESADELLNVTILNLIGTGNSPSELYKISSKLKSLNSGLSAFQKQIECKIEAAEEKHELRRIKRQDDSVYHAAADKIIANLNMYIEDEDVAIKRYEKVSKKLKNDHDIDITCS